MKATISPKLLALVFASSVLLRICAQAAAPREDHHEATFTTIDFPGASQTVARGINTPGDIVGRYGSTGANHGYLLSGDEFTSIDFPGASITTAWGVNSRGGIVGQYFTAGVSHGYLLSGGEFKSIDFPGASFTEAWGINPRGDIVGDYITDGVSHGYLLSREERDEDENIE